MLYILWRISRTQFCISRHLIRLRPAIDDGFMEQLSRAQQAMLKASSQGMYKVEVLPTGVKRVTGGKRLKSSGRYTSAFGKRVAQLLLKQRLKVSWLIFFASLYLLIQALCIQGPYVYMLSWPHSILLVNKLTLIYLCMTPTCPDVLPQRQMPRSGSAQTT